MQAGLAGIVTGASSGIGKAVAVRLAEQYQAKLVINARNSQLLQETANQIERAGGKAICVAGDISDRELSAKLVDTCLSGFGGLTLLVNNAGLAKPGPVKALTPDDWHYVFNVNFFGPLYLTYAALPHLLAQKSGKIVNISSVAGKVSFPGSVCYAASKFALTGMSEGMAAELQSQGIDVITVCPGWVRSEFFTNVKMPDKRNPTVIAQRKDLIGWLMRNCLSVSSEAAAIDIVRACERGGGREIVLTAPGVIMERAAGLCPSLVHAAAKRYPPDRA